MLTLVAAACGGLAPPTPTGAPAGLAPTAAPTSAAPPPSTIAAGTPPPGGTLLAVTATAGSVGANQAGSTVGTTVPVGTTPPSAANATSLPIGATALAATPGAGVTAGRPADSPAAELALAISSAPPKRDLLDLARRFKVKPGTATAIPTAMPEAQVGESRQFWVADSARKTYFKVTARLTQRTDHVDFYVQEGERVDADGVSRSLDTIERTILPGLARDFAAGSLPMDKLRFAILNTRLRGLVGYYSSVDEYPRWVAPFSNERSLIAMSLQAVQPGSRGYDSGLAHELEHLIQWRLDPAEDTWVNEGTAELAIRAVGLDPSGNFQSFLQQPDTQLNDWAEAVGDTPPHYGAADLFFTYLGQRFGGYTTVGEVLARRERGIAGVEAVLRQKGEADAPFARTFVDWTIANWADQGASGGRYGYRGLPPVRPRDEALAGPGKVDGTVHQFGARYYALGRPPAGSAVSVETQPTVKLIAAPERPGPFWWSNRSDSGDSRLTREVDLTRAQRATLRFTTWHDLERDFDYGYVSVSRDGGRTWTTLPGQSTNAADPTGSNYGVGYTGKSGGSGRWIDESIDLTPYAGTRINLRLEMVTDDAYNGGGFAVDALEIPEIGWRDSPDDVGWTAEGFLRIRNRVPQQVSATLIGVAGGEVRVVTVPIGADGRGRLELPAAIAAADRIGLVISGLTPITNQPMPFTVVLEKG